MNLRKDKYKNIIKFKKKFNFTDFDLISNYGLFLVGIRIYLRH